MEIQREASDKLKGITLQKVRALKLAFDTIIGNPKAQVHIAIEYGGDVFIYSDTRKFIEENKNYESKNFSFASTQVLNTLVYFLDYWLRDDVQTSPTVFFSFYTTNNIAKEYLTDRIKGIQVTLPHEPMLGLLSQYHFEDKNLLEACKGLLLDEYQLQYKGQNHKYAIIAAWTAADWEKFFHQIQWNFGMPDHLTVKSELTQSILAYGEKKGIPINGKEEFIRAWLRERLEDNQYETDHAHRFLTDTEIENAYHRIKGNQIPASLYRYIETDYTELRAKTKDFVLNFMKVKYNALVPHYPLPSFLDRKVKMHSAQVKIKPQDLAISNPELGSRDIITGEIGAFITSSKPNFLFGEIGSGKSSLISQYAISEIDKDGLCLFVPVSYLKGLITQDLQELIAVIEKYINQNMPAASDGFNFDLLLRSASSAHMIIDGLDELAPNEAKLLIGHLYTLKQLQENVIIIATGRPLELQNMVNYNDWNCITTLDLTEDEIYELLKREAINAGLKGDEVEIDTQRRLNFLNSRRQLKGISTTPLIVCLIRDYLTENLEDESLGTLMYKIFLKRLDWNAADAKVNYQEFFTEFPSIYQREKLISTIAFEIGTSDKQLIKEERLFEVTDTLVPQLPNRNKVVSEAIAFSKEVFLQQSANSYSFTSQPLFEIAYALSLAERIRIPGFTLTIVTNNWRPISFAMAINRLKGYTIQNRPYLKTALDELLRFDSNTSYGAALVSESKDPEIATYYIDKTSKLKFRPLNVWAEEGSMNSPDSFSPYVIADTISLAGKKGFEWFFNEYMNPKNPCHHHDESIIKHVLKNYLAIKSFQLEPHEIAAIKSIIPYHIAAETGFCGEIFSVFAQVTPEIFEEDKLYRLTTEALSDHQLYKNTRQLIQEGIDTGKLPLIMNGLEIVCGIDHHSKNAAAKLWLEITDGPINIAVLNAAIMGAANGDNRLYDTLISRIGSEPFEAMLRFMALNLLPSGDYAALLLFEKFGVTEFYIIGRPILVLSDWNQFNDPKRRKILDRLLVIDTEMAVKHVLTHTPFKKHKEAIPELYLYYFIQLISTTQEIYKNQFLYCIRHLPEYSVLSRHSEVREKMKELLESHPQYREFLCQGMENLDYRLRFNCNSILLACFPENSIKELENTIRSANKRLTDAQEWIRFCMKLNYSKETLLFIKKLLPDLPKTSRYYALFILYHQNINLSEQQTGELLEGLLGDGQHFDHDSSFMGTDGLKAIGRDENFIDYFITSLDSSDNELRYRAAAMLYYYHMDKLSKPQQAKVYLMEAQKNTRLLVEFDFLHEDYFGNEEFVKALVKEAGIFASVNNKEPLLYTYYKAMGGDESYWLPFLKAFVFEGRFEPYDLEWCYRWLKTIEKDKYALTEFAGKAAIELMGYPAVGERKDYNNTIYQLAIIGNEFGNLSKAELLDVLKTYGSQDDLICSLLFRVQEIPERFRGRRSEPYYLNFFANNNTRVIQKYSKSDIEKILVDAPSLPPQFEEALVSEIIYPSFTLDKLAVLAKQGNTSALLYSIIAFCRESTVDFKLLLNASDQLGWPFYRQPSNAYLRATLYLIKEMQINDPASRAKYVEILISRIRETENKFLNDVDEYFKELFNLEAGFPVELLNILFKHLIDQSHSLNSDLFYQILLYISTKVEEPDFDYLAGISRNYIKGILNQFEKDGRHSDNVSMLWMLGLISFYTEKKAENYSISAYLIGLEGIFLFQTDNNALNDRNQKVSFKGKDLLVYSLPLYEKIPVSLLKESVMYGIENGTPEIKSICRVLNGFTA